jgi:type I restriction enzyme M protein
MAVKKSELYSTLWKSCDKLRGGMDASQYKDYVLVLLFMKYVSDRSKNAKNSLLDIPEGGGFADLVKLKGKAHIGDGINKVIGKLADANDLRGVIDVADFNDDAKLGKGKEMVDRLSDLIAIFENPALDFSSNQADGDDLLGDAYEYLMRNFATESGKSKGQFYTPAEVSRIMAAVIGIDKAKSQKETIYDPTCGSGSLLLKAHDLAKAVTGHDLAIYGQEMDNATAALSRMNMWLHNAGTAEIANNNTLSAPQFTDEKTGALRTFDYVVANPPFSVKSWTTGVNVGADPYKRFVYGTPPEKNGDYAFLLHILTSLKATGKGAVILPHGVLFRGNAEAVIRQNLVKQGFIKAIIGLPANLFYGTGIPACIIVLDKEGAAARDHVFMIDASKGFVKDGPKNRLRERDIHRIVSTFLTHTELDKYSRKVPVSEIADPKNDYNLNLPRYIDTSEPEDLQDLDAHLNGGIPDRDIDALDAYWKVFPSLRKELFEPAGRPGYGNLTLPAAELSAHFTRSDEYAALKAQAVQELQKWIGSVKPKLLAINDKSRPKELVNQISEALMATFKASVLLDEYAIYQGLMELSAETLLDDAYLIADNGWKDAAQLKALPVETDEKGKKKKRTGRVDFTINKIEHRSELLPPELLINRFFEKEARECADALSAAEEKLEELASTYGGEDMLLSDVSNDKGEFTKKAVADALKETTKTDEEFEPLKEVLDAIDAEAAAKKLAKDLDAKVIAKYGKLTEDEIKQMVVDDKWLGAVEVVVEAELSRVAGSLVSRLQQLHRRYGTTAPALEASVSELLTRVQNHLKSMGLAAR